MVEKLQRRFALSRKGAVDTIKGSLLCALQNISFMLPVCMLYYLVVDMLGGTLTASRIPFYAVGTVICAAVILVCTYLQYNSTFLATYVETGVRRISLAEKLRRIPLSFFGKKDLADLTSAIMNDCAVLETSQSHHICPLIGAIISTTLIALSLFIFNWRMALASVWVLPLAFCIVGLAAGVQKSLSSKSMAARISCEDGIQECMESMPDLRANNAEKRYLAGLNKKLRAFESRLTKSELGTAVFVVTASLVLRLGIATTALVGSYLLIAGELDIITFFMFLLVVSRLYDPLEGSLQNLAAIISTSTNIKRMNEILDHPVQEGEDKLTNDGCDIVFDHVGFAYDGDADRCLCVDEKGNVVTGDHILYIYGCYMKEHGELMNNTVVTTVMSNFGLYKAFDEQGIGYAKTAVGDKYVYEYMAKNGCRIGGEQSGHIIFSKYASTGDGILTSLKMMEVMLAKKLPMSKLAEPLKIYPQVLENVRVTDKKAAQNDPAVQEAVKAVAEALGDTGRILVRESGTEPLVRVMVEAPDHDTCQKYVSQVVEVIKSKGYAV